MVKNAEVVLSALDESIKTASVSELAKMGITIEGLSDDMDAKEREKLLRMYRRKIANRESAKRSKIRKKAEDAKLLSAAETLLQDSASMRKTITDLQKKVDTLYAENVKLRMKLGEKVSEDTGPSMKPVNLPPEVEPPSLVMKEARKKKRGMLKSMSDSSIATTFEEETRALPIEEPSKVTKRAKGKRATINEPNPLLTQDQLNYLNHPDDSGYVLQSFLMNDSNRPGTDSPFFTDNYAMYDFQDGEVVDDGVPFF
jgi:plant G-box-binding factor